MAMADTRDYYDTATIKAVNGFIVQAPVANVTKLFSMYCVTISITSVKIIEKYATSGINYA
jgi:hypothetical protein